MILVFVLATKKLVLSDNMFNVLYDGRKIYQNLSYEECSEILQDLAEEYYENDQYDPDLIELEEV